MLFVCLGNICRSPLAEAIFRDLARREKPARSFRIDSCGTGAWHVGEPSDPRSIAVARRHGLEMPRVARQFDPASDIQSFQWLIAMDRSNAGTLIKLGSPPSRVHLMRSFDPALESAPGPDLDVPDPYHWPGDGFEEVYTMLRDACAGLLARLRTPERS